MGKAIINKESHAEIVNMFKAGRTMQAIGASFGVTRERVRQILFMYEVDTKSGGKSLIARCRRQVKEKTRDISIRKRYGCSARQYDELAREYGFGNGSPFRAFTNQKRNALARQIDWKFTFWGWWKLWEKSGKWAERGRGKYVMARNGDAGPYEKNNVYICTASDNSKDALKNKPWHARKVKHRKISDDDVIKIRELQGTNVEIAKIFNVNPSTISVIRNGKSRVRVISQERSKS